MAYAEKTSVPPEKTKAEIEILLKRYGATEFASGWGQDRAIIQFSANKRILRFELPLPSRQDKKFTRDRNGWSRTDKGAQEAYDQEVRRLWRALLLTIKAKLESVESGIETFESAFLSNIVMPGGKTVGQHVSPAIEEAYTSGRMPPLLLTAGGPQ